MIFSVELRADSVFLSAVRLDGLFLIEGYKPSIGMANYDSL